MLLIFISNYSLTVFSVLFCVLVSNTFGSEAKCASVTYDNKTKKFAVHDSIVDKAVAYGHFKNEINVTGWSYLEVKSNELFPDPIQAYAAGLVEGFLTKFLIKKHYRNVRKMNVCPLDPFCKPYKKFFKKNLDFIKRNVETKRACDIYWHHVALTLEQLCGLQDGYRNKIGQPSLKIDPLGLSLINTVEVKDLKTVLMKEESDPTGSGSCSALVKVLPNTKDIYFAHTSWNTYDSMLRVLKKYSLKFHISFTAGSPIIPGHTYSFSSYPGLIYSLDDFYLISTGLAAMETTLDNKNESLWKYIVPDKIILEWQRNIIANRLANDGKEWTQIFKILNSGTYNNQWMILDYSKFQPGKPLKDGLLWVLEQMPGHVHSEDVTDVLRKQKYWPSYNVAYFEDIFNISGQPGQVKEHGDFFTYDKTPRAKIFKRDHNKVKDMKSLIKLMRYNNYTKDPLSKCNCTPPYSATNAISARADLNPPNGTFPIPSLGNAAFGAIDMKATTSKLVKKFEFVAIAGPTYDPLPPFQWSKSTRDIKLLEKYGGQPDLWKFKPILHKWM